MARGDRTETAGAAGAAAAGAGASLGVAAVAACCVSPVISPLIVAALGAGGAAWAAGLAPFAPYLLAGSLALVGLGFRLAYRRSRECAAGAEAPRPKPPAWLRATLWGALVVWVGSLAITLLFSGGR